MFDERRACDDAAGVTQKMMSKEAEEAPDMVDDDNPVSYTHLTLPTICSV